MEMGSARSISGSVAAVGAVAVGADDDGDVVVDAGVADLEHHVDFGEEGLGVLFAILRHVERQLVGRGLRRDLIAERADAAVLVGARRRQLSPAAVAVLDR